MEKLYEHSQKCTIKHQILILQKFTNFVDVKEEDKSEESKQNHIRYYKSLSQTIADIREEEKQEQEVKQEEEKDNTYFEFNYSSSEEEEEEEEEENKEDEVLE